MSRVEYIIEASINKEEEMLVVGWPGLRRAKIESGGGGNISVLYSALLYGVQAEVDSQFNFCTRGDFAA